MTRAVPFHCCFIAAYRDYPDSPNKQDPPRVRHKDLARSAASLQRRGSLSLCLDHTQKTLSSSSLVSQWRHETSFNVARSTPPSPLSSEYKMRRRSTCFSRRCRISSSLARGRPRQLTSCSATSSYKLMKARWPAHGHLKQHGEDVCYDVVTVANHETTDTLCQALQWRAGELLDIRKFGT
ncbi:hypothetical protein HPB49_011671 [Dermacentor silvarum]|uniref:Uncharacterized protein n=1 Tax=Dermacentor silvarum TaxID=543639 RepID=A0ACB8DPB2_DERSI|nr:hypothetical protein HPB49_011671 [Dermacentor silvarum]